ncbi:hypothetical protein [Bacteroides acidifaciens]|uniref:hypothetical protein n=1 Tax=Bacteroides acidifaciens TaxID=85831 RepID=UPI0026E00B22|nr:hypothetical protein [Bacteroides acidifaciens]
MADLSINKLSEKDMINAYRFIYIFENEVYPNYGTFDFNSFCQEHRIKKKDKRSSRPSDNYFWFDSIKIQGALNNDFAHNFLRHVRNAIAHGNFKKVRGKKPFYIIEDYNKNSVQTMFGKIHTDIFWEYLSIVLHTSIVINKNITFK